MSSLSEQTGVLIGGQSMPARSSPIVWARKGALAITDQGLIAGSNFMLNVLLARWLTPVEYGAYALAFSAFLLLAGFHEALLVGPMGVLGPILYRESTRHYVGAVLRLHVKTSLAIAAILGATAVLSSWFRLPWVLVSALAGLAVAAPWVLLLWLLRGSFYLKFSHGTAVVGALLYCVLLLGGLLIVFRDGQLTPFTAFLVMTVAAAVVCGFLLLRLKPVLGIRTGGPRAAGVWTQHWNYGRWEVGSVVVAALAQNVAYGLAAAFLGMAQAGALRALANLALPAAHAGTALRRLVQPYVSTISGARGHSAVRAPVTTICLVYGGGSLAYVAFLTAFTRPIFRMLYGGKFMEFAYLVPLVALSVAFSSTGHAFNVGLRALQLPSLLFVADCTAAAINVLVGVPATRLFGLTGLVCAGALSAFAALVVSSLYFRRRAGASGQQGASACPA